MTVYSYVGELLPSVGINPESAPGISQLVRMGATSIHLATRLSKGRLRQSMVLDSKREDDCISNVRHDLVRRVNESSTSTNHNIVSHT